MRAADVVVAVSAVHRCRPRRAPRSRGRSRTSSRTASMQCLTLRSGGRGTSSSPSGARAAPSRPRRRGRSAWPASSCGWSERGGSGGVDIPGWVGRPATRSWRRCLGRALSRLPIALRRFRAPGARGHGVLNSSRHERGGATEEVAGGSAVLVDPFNPGADRRRDHGSGAQSQRAGQALGWIAHSRSHRISRPSARGDIATGSREFTSRRRGSSRPAGRRTGDETFIPRSAASASGARRRRGAAHRGHDSSTGSRASRCRADRARDAKPGLRMAWALPRVLARHDAALVHTQYALPLRCPCPAVVTIHDLSFERDPASMGRWRSHGLPSCRPASGPRAQRGC